MYAHLDDHCTGFPNQLSFVSTRTTSCPVAVGFAAGCTSRCPPACCTHGFSVPVAVVSTCLSVLSAVDVYPCTLLVLQHTRAALPLLAIAAAAASAPDAASRPRSSVPLAPTPPTMHPTFQFGWSNSGPIVVQITNATRGSADSWSRRSLLLPRSFQSCADTMTRIHLCEIGLLPRRPMRRRGTDCLSLLQCTGTMERFDPIYRRLDTYTTKRQSERGSTC
jgi:hypothetical protein